MKFFPHPERAFSLVELSIVLVILGLLVGGILAGQSLVHASELRAIGTEYNRFKTAGLAFKDKYFYIPGDMPNATSFWGTATCPGDGTGARTGTLTCNGNGDAMIGTNAPTSFQNESPGLWQHLVNAGMIEGSYSGVTTGPFHYSAGASAGVNVPASRYGNTFWSIIWMGSYDVTDVGYAEGSYGNAMFLSPSSTNFFHVPGGSVLSSQDMWNVDTKLDDGYPLTGTLVTMEGNPAASNQCWRTSAGGAPTTSNTLPRATNGFVYYLANTIDPACPVIFKNIF